MSKKQIGSGLEKCAAKDCGFVGHPQDGCDFFICKSCFAELARLFDEQANPESQVDQFGYNPTIE